MLFKRPFGGTRPKWEDPIKTLHMRKESDVVLIFAGTLLAQRDLVFWKCDDTGDRLTPCVVPPQCIVSVRDGETGDIVHTDDDALRMSALGDCPAQYWFATGSRAASSSIAAGGINPGASRQSDD